MAEPARVSVWELVELAKFGRRLEARGPDATCCEWVAFLEAKADLLDRIAADPRPLMPPDRARRDAEAARDQAEWLRREAADWWWL
jgi:hypothetical protein